MRAFERELKRRLAREGCRVVSLRRRGNTHYAIRVAADGKECELSASSTPANQDQALNHVVQALRRKRRQR